MNSFGVFDSQHQLEACRFEVPIGWQATGRVDWNYQNTSHAVHIYAATYNPDGLDSIEFYPVESFFWLEPSYMVMVPPGQAHLGQVCLPPRPAFQAMLDWAIPKYRGHRQNLRVVSAGPYPQLTQMLGTPGEGAGVKLEYVEAGTSLEEEFYGISTYMQNGNQTNWGLVRLLSFRAQRGGLEALRPTFWQVARSLQANPAFESMCGQVYQQLAQGFQQHIAAGYQSIEDANQIGRAAAAYREDVRQHQQQAFNHRMQTPQPGPMSGYSMSEARGDLLMGRTRYEDPNAPGGVSYDYGHHERVWSDGTDYQRSNDPNFDPNIGSSRTWVELKRSDLT